MAHPELKNIIEAALLIAGQPLTVDRMIALFTEDTRPTRDEVHEALRAIEAGCEGRGIELRQIDKGWRFQTREVYASFLQRLSEERPQRYSRALLETLAIIAYRQPVTRAEIEEIRGVAVSTDIIKTLIGREWVRQVGQRDVPGKPGLYGTTPGFLEHFNLKSLDELPPLSELRDIDKIAAELNFKLPPAAGENAGADAATIADTDTGDEAGFAAGDADAAADLHDTGRADAADDADNASEARAFRGGEADADTDNNDIELAEDMGQAAASPVS